MSEPRHRPEHAVEHGLELDRDDAAFVRRIAESYGPPAATPSGRVAFRTALDARLRRRSARWVWAAAAVSAAAAAGLVLLRAPAPFAPTDPLPSPVVDGGSAGEGSAPAVEPMLDGAAEEMLLALALPATAEDESLPADYEAIADLFMEGV